MQSLMFFHQNYLIQKVCSKFWLWFGYRPQSVWLSIPVALLYVYLTMTGPDNNWVHLLGFTVAAYMLFQLIFSMKWEIDWFFSQIDFIKGSFCECCSTAEHRRRAFERMRLLAEHLYLTRNWFLKDREHAEKFIVLLDDCKSRSVNFDAGEDANEILAEDIYQLLMPVVNLNHRSAKILDLYKVNK